MRTSEVFVLGTIAGAVVGWWWGREIEDYVRAQTRGVRTKAAEGMRAAGEMALQVLERGGNSQRRAEGFLENTKERVRGALRAGQDAIRPAPTTG
jgi:hypothetical protein